MIKLLRNHYHKRYHGIYQHAKKLFVFDLGLLLLALLMLGSSIFLFFWKPGIAGLIDMSISLGNGRLKSGDEIRLTIDYANKSKFKLNNVSLGLHLPEGFIINRNKTPKEIFSNDSTFASIKEINAGATGQTEIYGWFWSEPNKETKFTANLSYQPENNSNREQKLSSFVARLSDSVITGQLDMPDSTLPNTPLKFTYTLKNSSNREINNISIFFDSSANLNNEADTKNFSLPANGVKIIEGQITTPNRSGDFSFTIIPQILVNNHLLPLAPSTKNLKIFAPHIISSAALLDNSRYAEPGQILPVQIKWENKSDFKLTNVVLHLTSNLQNVVDWKKTAAENGAKLETNGLFFDSASRTQLSNGNPNSADTFTVKINLLPSFNLPETEKANLEIYPVVSGQASQTSQQQFRQEGSRIRLPLATAVTFNVETRYYTSEGDQLGRGPLPPQVGKITKYWIFVKISNGSNAINDVAFNSSLPAGVDFTGKQSTSIGPQIDLNSDRSVSWRYNTLPANSQTGLYFEVAVTPDASQIGQNLLLTNSLHFSATDDFTNKKFDLTRSGLNNILSSNDQGRNSGSKVTE